MTLGRKSQAIHALLIDKRDMLSDYFNITITPEGDLCTLPLLLKGYLPSMGKLPTFLLRLGPNVDWTSELECFDTMLRELAGWYVPEMMPAQDDEVESSQQLQQGEGLDSAAVSSNTGASARTTHTDDDVPGNGNAATSELSRRRIQLANAIENVLFPAAKKRLIPPTALLRYISEVANLKGLYRIFERC